MYIDFSADQQHFIKKLAVKFGWYDPSMDLPDMIYIEIRFRTFDISNPEVIFMNDYLSLAVKSNGEKPSSFCDFSQLVIDPSTAMRGQRNYKISSSEAGHIHTQQIPILTEITGWEYVQKQEGCY
jgi:hypothetical protein